MFENCKNWTISSEVPNRNVLNDYMGKCPNGNNLSCESNMVLI